MIAQEVIDKLNELKPKVKALMGRFAGQVTFNCPKDPKQEPKVTIVVADVTEVKK